MKIWFCLSLALSFAASTCFGQSNLDQLLGASTEAELIAVHQSLNVPRGDADGDGVTTFADFLIMTSNFKGIADPAPGDFTYRAGDFNLDGIVDLGDHAILSGNFGERTYQPEPALRDPLANLGLSLNAENQLVISSATDTPIGGIELDSPSGALTPPGEEASAAPYPFFLGRSSDSVSFGTLASGIPIQGDFTTNTTSSSQDVSIRWFEHGSYQVYSRGFGEGDALTGNPFVGSEQPNNPRPGTGNPQRPEKRVALGPRRGQLGGDVPTDFSDNCSADLNFNGDGGVNVADLDATTNADNLRQLEMCLDIRRGDVLLDGAVAFADFLTISRNHGLKVDSYRQGDFNRDGGVDIEDFAYNSVSFGDTGGYQADPTAPTPSNVSVSVSDNGMVTLAVDTPTDFGGIEIGSQGGNLVSYDERNATPFSFHVGASDNSVVFGSLRIGVTIDGTLETSIEYDTSADSESDLFVRWFQAGSPQVFSNPEGSKTPFVEPSDEPIVIDPPDEEVDPRFEFIPSTDIIPIVDDGEIVLLNQETLPDTRGLIFESEAGNLVPITDSAPYAFFLRNTENDITLGSLRDVVLEAGEIRTGIEVLNDASFTNDLTFSWGIGPQGYTYMADPAAAMVDNLWADLNGDGSVTFSDFITLSTNFGQTVTDHSLGDVDHNGVVEFKDFLILSESFGQSIETAQVVPEPSGIWMASFGLVGLLARRRRNR